MTSQYYQMILNLHGIIFVLRNIIFWLGTLFVIVCVFSVYPFPPLDSFKYVKTFLANINLVKNVLSVTILFLIVCILIIGISSGRYSFKIEKLTLGGVNILFDNSDKLFKKSLKNYLDSKRTLFSISFERDNFDETLTSFFNTYNFIRDEMKILNLRKRADKNMYHDANEILKTLNSFLTKHQNDFRRWYKYVSSNDKVEKINNTQTNNEPLVFHLTTIEEIQKQYYRYEELKKDLQDINIYFNNNVKNKFNINTEKWA